MIYLNTRISLVKCSKDHSKIQIDDIFVVLVIKMKLDSLNYGFLRNYLFLQSSCNGNFQERGYLLSLQQMY